MSTSLYVRSIAAGLVVAGSVIALPRAADAQYGPYGPRPYAYRSDFLVALRVDASEPEAEVFVDGYRAGIVDDFDGVFQRLRLEPGGHELTIYLKGFRTIREPLYLSPGASRTLRYKMVPLASGETSEPPPAPAAPTRDRDPNAPPDLQTERDRRVPQRPEREAVVRTGSISLRLQPADAEIFIDGEKWTGTIAATERTIIRLNEGRHKIEVKKSGYATYTEEVLIRDGATLTLNVVLTK